MLWCQGPRTLDYPSNGEVKSALIAPYDRNARPSRQTERQTERKLGHRSTRPVAVMSGNAAICDYSMHAVQW